MPTALNERTAPLVYGAAMALWIVLVANSHREPPTLLVLVLLSLPVLLHLGVGWIVGRWWALALGGLPLVAAIASAGLDSNVTVFVAMLTIFPGVPLIAAGVFLRLWRDEREEDPADELWML